MWDTSIPTSGAIAMSDFHGTVSEYQITLSSSEDNVNLRTKFEALYGVPSVACMVRATINAGVVIGSTSAASPALTIGSFPSGSTVTIINNGTVQGAGGTAGAALSAGGAGGRAIDADTANLTMNITNEVTGILQGGGGGGGGGGTGGAGSYVQNLGELDTFSSSGCHQSCVNEYGAGATCTDGTSGSCYCRYSGRTCRRTVATSGGTGGAGGRGEGDDGARASGSTGSAGGTSAGAGGTGGTGGLYGAAGSAGSTGAAGNAGSGVAGGAGGAAGYYLYRNSRTVTVTNHGTVAGQNG